MEEKTLAEYFELLRFESVGADPAHLHDCVACASWFRRWLARLGFSVELVYPDGEKGVSPPPPVVVAERKGGEGAATVLVYGHYDVQPADPLGEWKTPPFEPTLVDGRVYCRGANDDKGQLFALLCGLRDYLGGEGERKLNLKVVLDGQEESGSGALTLLAPTLRRRLAADVLLV
ncbi:MAG: M20/M25/M40 family metallo-hydrolase, partial [Kiritimatiellae bacterium]|nr:M20/M25/M40 family metallo-hydrolase [Kiritimatiellia bacterium]